MRNITGLVLFSVLLCYVLADCPMDPSPANTHTGSIVGVLDPDSMKNQYKKTFEYPLVKSLNTSKAVKVAIGITGFEFNSNGRIEYSLEYLPTTLATSLSFIIKINQTANLWRQVKFCFFASQNQLFGAISITAKQFSRVNNNKYALYRPVDGNFSPQSVIKTFLNGATIVAKPLDQQYNKMVEQFQGFKKFSNNAKLIASFSQAIQIKKSLSLKIDSSRLSGRLHAVTFDTNGDFLSVSYTGILFTQRLTDQSHNTLITDISLINSNQQKFTNLQNPDTQILGLTGFRTPRSQLHSFQLLQQNIDGITYLTLDTNYKYLQLSFSYASMEVKYAKLCASCPSSPIHYDERFCVSQCPKSFSLAVSQGIQYCDLCEIDKLKVVDRDTGFCVCAKRHYADAGSDSCKPCGYDCMTCQKANQCLTCDNSMMQTKRKLTSGGRCTCPLVGYYDDKQAQNIVCQKCHPRCLTCNGPRQNNCLSCQSSKQLDPKGLCVCKNGYIEDASLNCICPPPRQLTSSNICIDLVTPCPPNKTETFISETRRCICKPGFITVLDNCIKCGPNSIFNQQTLQCQCVNGTVPISGGGCRNCQQNEVYEKNSKICICASGSYRGGNGDCVRCPAKMMLFGDNCQSSPNVCKPCKRETDGPKCKRTLS